MRIIIVRNINTMVESVRPKISQQNRAIVKSIILDVKKRKDKAIKEYEKKFTGASLKSIKVSQSEIKQAYSKVTKDQIAAIKLAKKRLEKLELAVKKQLKKIIGVTSPNKNGMIDPLTLVAGDICGIDEFYKTGGAQAIAALAYGTES